MESVVGGVVSAVKAMGRVTGHTPTRQQTNAEVVDKPTHKDWTWTETEGQYAEDGENTEQGPTEAPMSSDGAHAERDMAREEIKFQSETSSATGSTKEEFAEMLRKFADESSDEEQQSEEQTEPAKPEVERKRTKPRLVDAAERKAEEQAEIEPNGLKMKEGAVGP